MSKDNGGSAFPGTHKVEIELDLDGDVRTHLVDRKSPGMTLRDYLAAKAPVSYEVALAVWGDNSPPLTEDRTRAAFFAVWALLRYEWADAMLAQRST